VAAVNVKTSFFLDVALCGLIRNDAVLASRRNYFYAGQKIFSASVRFKTVYCLYRTTKYRLALRYKVLLQLYMFVSASIIFQ